MTLTNSLNISFNNTSAGRYDGEMLFDITSNKMLVWSQVANAWQEVTQNIIPDTFDLTPQEIDLIKKYTENIEKYEKVLREFFPEDYL